MEGLFRSKVGEINPVVTLFFVFLFHFSGIRLCHIFRKSAKFMFKIIELSRFQTIPCFRHVDFKCHSCQKIQNDTKIKG